MKKLLTATTALALVGGAAFAEITISGDAKLGLDYNSEPADPLAPGVDKSEHSFKHEVGIDFTFSGTTDGGLTFGGKAGFDTGDTETNEGTVFVSSDFGKITIGGNDSADLLAGGIADVGLNGIGVDDVAESLRGTTANQFRYDHSFGPVSIAVSAGTKDGTAAVAAKDGLWTLTNNSTKAETGFTSATAFGAYDKAIMFLGSLTGEGAANAYIGAAPTDGTTDPFALIRASGFNFTIGRVAAKGDAKAQVNVSLAAVADVADANTYNIAGFSKGKETGSVLDADGEAVTVDAQKNAFNAYAAAYDLGTDGKVGGGDDMANATLGALLYQANAPVVAVPATSADDEYAFGMSFAAGGMTIGFGHDSNDTNSVGLGFGTGDIATNVMYVKADAATGMGADVSYTMGASVLTLAYASRDPDVGEKMDAMGVHVAHDLGGGATLNAGFGQVDDANKASMGIAFKF